TVCLHPHALRRIAERGASEAEVALTVQVGEAVPAKSGRTRFKCSFSVQGIWRGRPFQGKQLEAVAVLEEDRWVVITVLVKYF
ncbi:MAG: DUF4258 domain-containing protein, partial [Alphaproteobacteria bacterium]